MKGFVGDIEKLTEDNSDFRRVLYTGKNLQLVLMAIEPGGEIGEEVHDDGDQFFRVEKGKGEVVIDGHRSKIKGDDAIIVIDKRAGLVALKAHAAASHSKTYAARRKDLIASRVIHVLSPTRDAGSRRRSEGRQPGA